MLTRRLLALGAGCALLAASGVWAQVELIWDSPPNNDLPAFDDQQFDDSPDFSTYLVAHVRFERAYFIHSIITFFTDLNHTWPNGRENVEAVLTIIPQDNDLPPNGYNPAGPQQGGMGLKVLADLLHFQGGFSRLATNINGGVLLQPGDYWFGLTPKLNLGQFGQEFHIGTDNWLKNTAGKNPGGGVGVGTRWFDAGQTFGAIDWGMAIKITGENVPTDCPWDLDNNGVVGATDLLSLLVNWGPCSHCPADFDNNGTVGATDLLKLLVNWGGCLGGKPNGACCLPSLDFGCGIVQPDPVCIIATAFACQAAGGTYLGDGVPCEQTIPALIHTSPQLNHEVVTASLCGADRPNCVDGPYEVDPWTTVDGTGGGTNAMDFGVDPIPADFFGPGSDPFDGQVQLRGEPLGEIQLPGFPDPLDFGDADTLVRRLADPFDRCILPPSFPSDPVEVDIELVALSLRSCDPITVTFNGGQNPEEWDVRVNLSDFVPQPGGTLEAVKTHCNGGTYKSALEVCPRFIFTKVADPQHEVQFDFCADAGLPILLVLNEDSPWVHDLSQSVGQPSPVCSAFNPGIDDNAPNTDCDCNQNSVRDDCEPDTDNDGVIDDCDNCPDDPNSGQEDGDKDGWGTACDCDDNDPDVNPGVEESAAAGNCNDGIDNDCDGNTDAADPDCP